MSRTWITEPELHAIREALAGPWLPAEPEAELRRELAWFPEPELLRWFLRGNGREERDVQALPLAEAIEWRRQLLLRNLPSPLSSTDRFLPLVRCPQGFLIYDGAARGLALRRTRQPERYEAALQTPLRLSELLSTPTAPRRADPEDEEDEEDENPEPVRVPLEDHLDRALGAAGPSRSLEQLQPLCDTDELREWFTRVGPTTRLLLSDLRAFCFSDALVTRDLLEAASSPELQAQLHHSSWMPLLELPGRHAVLYWKNRGVRLHVHRDGAWQAAAWSRCVSFETFLAALSAWAEPQLPHHEEPDVIVDKLWGLADTWEAELPERDVDATRLAGLSLPGARAAEAWFSRAPEPPFAEASERLVSSDSLEPGLAMVPLLRGDDGVETWVLDGRGVVLRCGEARLPWAPSVTDWTSELDAAAGMRGTPGVLVTRNFVGHYRVELPLLPYELARKLERLTAEQPEVLDPREFSIALGEKAEVRVERFEPTLVLDEDTRLALVADLDALRDAELTCLEVTFVFKPLRA